MHGQRSRDDVLQDKQLCVLVAQQQRGKREVSGSKTGEFKIPYKERC